MSSCLFLFYKNCSQTWFLADDSKRSDNCCRKWWISSVWSLRYKSCKIWFNTIDFHLLSVCDWCWQNLKGALWNLCVQFMSAGCISERQLLLLSSKNRNMWSGYWERWNCEFKSLHYDLKCLKYGIKMLYHIYDILNFIIIKIIIKITS